MPTSPSARQAGWRLADTEDLKTAELAWKDGAEALNVGYASAGNNKVRVFLFWHQL